MSLDRPKKDLPEINKNPFQKEEDKLDKTAGGSKLFKGDKVRGIAVCQDCNFPRIIATMSQLISRGLGLSKTDQKKRLDELEAFKDLYV